MVENGATKPGSLNQMRKLQAKTVTKENDSARQAKQRRPNYHQIHANPLPLVIYPLPSFLPQNPLSYLRILYTIAAHYCFPPNSHVLALHGYFDISTRAVHVTEAKSVRALWEMGFYGKGSLSRSEPNWLEQEKKRLGLLATSTSEEMTDQRRKERAWMKRERARIEQELLLAQIAEEHTSPRNPDSRVNGSMLDQSLVETPMPPEISPRHVTSIPISETEQVVNRVAQQEIAVLDEEHLQLSLEEAFFLIYALGVLKLDSTTSSASGVLTLFRQHSYFPVVPSSTLSPDDPFLVNYAVYHHYRSLGWVIREGIKFAVDYLLYESGPVFKHAAFAVMIVPSYSADYWKDVATPKTAVQKRNGIKSWTWLHCINRVQTQVLKTLVLCYVNIPSPHAIQGLEPGNILRRYKIREFSISRWSANRNRD